MVASLTWSDAKDGTGGTITVSGSSGASNTLYMAQVSKTDNWSFAVAGTRTGDGTIAVSRVPGPFLVVLQSNSAWSVPYYFRSTDGSEPIHWRCAQGIRDLVISLALPTLPTDPELHFVAKLGAKLDDVLNGNPNCVYYLPTFENYTPATNEEDTVEYPVNVVFNRESGQSLVKGLKDVLMARQRLHQGMSAPPLPGAPEIYQMRMEPGAVVDANRWTQNYDVSVLTFVCVCNQPFGIF